MAVLTTSALVAACGGGGGDAAGNTTVTTTTTTTSAASTIQNSGITAATYGVGSDKLAGYAYLNAQRLACGFGLLQQDVKLDIAAQAHADYQINNNTSGHGENSVAFPVGFTGANVYDRNLAAGYSSTTWGEGIAYSFPAYGTDLGQTNLKDLFAAPYHGRTLLLGYRDIGIGVGSNALRRVYSINVATTDARSTQHLAGNVVATYPCAGTTGVLTKTYYDESPAPIAGRNLATQPIGHPVYVKARDGKNLMFSTVDLRVDGGNTALMLNRLDRTTDQNNSLTDGSMIIFMPDAPLATNTTYRFTAAGTNNGAAVNINFTFTTGAF
ncbi:hypothetical protein [Noviherbaspirillum sedimenti]|uniref:SCP domain-containing protein n=1 Tax=Noviherbaspirillum sedimenti TaxID=2320865 RepID=A0A3A3G2E9_9BURK|nr:hypothetical protein [Noviherbaspirillum sedimenti]RJG02643.1 hypothetical protein D3878_14540 [Noviherbaspirillum sedimenti]